MAEKTANNCYVMIKEVFVSAKESRVYELFRLIFTR
jgi:hypothetical protein